ncbi:MAG: hypothetical protein NT079_03365 [Candidatus Omnitrophica bacterium]|nr:hypothetical protein [Candidatus Omnitrophota bacterium]
MSDKHRIASKTYTKWNILTMDDNINPNTIAVIICKIGDEKNARITASKTGTNGRLPSLLAFFIAICAKIKLKIKNNTIVPSRVLWIAGPRPDDFPRIAKDIAGTPIVATNNPIIIISQSINRKNKRWLRKYLINRKIVPTP